jgi:hypothetical protein
MVEMMRQMEVDFETPLPSIFNHVSARLLISGALCSASLEDWLSWFTSQTT